MNGWSFLFWFVVFAMLFALMKYMAVVAVILGIAYLIYKKRRA